jgi:phosphotriesterase-related protein
MTEVATATGSINTAALGRTLMHEHVLVITPEVLQNYPEEWDEQVRVEDAVEKLTALKNAGIDTIVDPTVVGLGRYIPRIVAIADRIELNIVVATGVYTYDSVPKYFMIRGPVMGFDLPDPMVDMFIRDITEGIADTGVKAAFLKCAIDEPGMTTDVERILRAVASAHLATGAPIMVHTAPAKHRGLEVHELLSGMGVAPSSVLLAHSGDSGDADHLSELAEHGYLLGMDRFGVDAYAPFEQRVGIVAELIRRGYAERMVLAHDASCFFDWIDPSFMAMATNWHYLHISQDVLPALLERGVSQGEIDTMLISNPRTWFDTRDHPA